MFENSIDSYEKTNVLDFEVFDSDPTSNIQLKKKEDEIVNQSHSSYTKPVDCKNIQEKSDFRLKLLQKILLQQHNPSAQPGSKTDTYSCDSENQSHTNIDNTLRHTFLDRHGMASISTSVTKYNVPHEPASIDPLNLDENCKFERPFNLITKKRKFPGPAGLLTKYFKESESPSKLLAQASMQSSLEEVFCSQNSAQSFAGGAWKQMLKDVNGVFGCNPFQHLNIRWLLRRVTFRSESLSQKIPLLAVMIHLIDLSHLDATAVFRDEMGQMNGMITNSVIEKYLSVVVPGTVLVLKDVSVIAPAEFRVCVNLKELQRKLYLNVNLNCILWLYQPDETGKVTKYQVADLCEEELRSLVSNITNPKTERRVLIEENHGESYHTEQMNRPISGNSSNVNLLLPHISTSTDVKHTTCNVTTNISNDVYTPRPFFSSNDPTYAFVSNNSPTATLSGSVHKYKTMQPNNSDKSNARSFSNHNYRKVNIFNNSPKINSSEKLQTKTANISLLMNPRSNNNPTNLSKTNNEISKTYSMNPISKTDSEVSEISKDPSSLNNQKVKYRFVSKSAINTTAPADSQPCIVHNSDREIINTINSNHATTTVSDAGNKLVKSVINFEDDDFDFLLSTIDTDSLKNF